MHAEYVLCLWGVSGLKKMLGADDSLDVFGVHGVGGITGALLTGVSAAPSLGGAGIWDYVTETGVAEYSIGSQVWIQAQGVLITVVLSSVAALVSYPDREVRSVCACLRRPSARVWTSPPTANRPTRPEGSPGAALH